MTADINHNPIEINTPRDPAISLMATVFAKPDLYIAAADAGFRLDHLRRLPSRCRDVMRRFAEAFARTDDWEAVANDFRQADPGFFRWLDAQNPGTVDAEQINALIMEVIASANGSALNGTTMPGGSNGHAGPARTHTDKPLPEALTKPGAATPGAEAKAEPLGNDEAEHDAPGAADAKQSSEHKEQDPEPAEGEQPPSDTEAEPPPSDERGDDDDLAKLSKGAKKALRRAIASMKLGKNIAGRTRRHRRVDGI
jgi:hypothetical protein